MPKKIVPMEIQGKTGNPVIDIVNKIGAGTLAKIFFLLSIVCFMFPFATISCAEQTHELRGYELIIGKQIAINSANVMDVSTNYIVAVTAACCIAGFLASLIKQNKLTTYIAMSAGALGIVLSLVFLLFFNAFVADYQQKTFGSVGISFTAKRGTITFFIPLILAGALFASYQRYVNLIDQLKLKKEKCLYTTIHKELEIEFARRMKLRSEIALSADKLSPISLPIKRLQKLATASSKASTQISSSKAKLESKAKPDNKTKNKSNNKKSAKSSNRKEDIIGDKVTTFPEIVPEEAQTSLETSEKSFDIVSNVAVSDIDEKAPDTAYDVAISDSNEKPSDVVSETSAEMEHSVSDAEPGGSFSYKNKKARKIKKVKKTNKINIKVLKVRFGESK